MLCELKYGLRSLLPPPSPPPPAHGECLARVHGFGTARSCRQPQPPPPDRAPRAFPALQMCHRRLWFNKHTPCGHMTFTTSQDVDCGQPTCHNSAAHPSTCLPPACRCRRYFTSVSFHSSLSTRSSSSPCIHSSDSQPERLISQEVSTISSDSGRFHFIQSLLPASCKVHPLRLQ